MTDTPIARRAEAVRLIEEGEYGAAAATLYRHVTADPRDIAVLANLGRACHRAGNFAEAARIFRVCLERRPDPACLAGLGRALAALDRADEAGRCFRDAIARDELCVEAWVALASLGPALCDGEFEARLRALSADERVTSSGRARLRDACCRLRSGGR